MGLGVFVHAFVVGLWLIQLNNLVESCECDTFFISGRTNDFIPTFSRRTGNIERAAPYLFNPGKRIVKYNKTTSQYSIVLKYNGFSPQTIFYKQLNFKRFFSLSRLRFGIHE